MFEQAPPDVDQALRARVGKFYQASVDGKFARVLTELIADDSKDTFLEMRKARCRKFEIISIKYSDNFTKATVATTCDTDYAMPGVGIMKVNAPLSSTWKVIDGQWYWYVDPTSAQMTPFGMAHAGPEPANGAQPSLPADPLKGPNMGAVARSVKADKTEVRFASRDATDKITITNNLTGYISLVVDATAIPGLEVKVSSAQVAPRQSTELSLRYAPQGAASRQEGKLQVRVEPTGQVIPIHVVADAVAAPPGAGKLVTGLALTAGKLEVRLPQGAKPATDTVKLTNTSDERLSLSLEPTRVPGLEIKLNRAELGPQESAELSLRVLPARKPARRDVVIQIHVKPTNQVVPIHVIFGPGSTT